MMKHQGFFFDVYRLIAQIPPGKTMTYGQIAAALGQPRSARIVGYALRAAPETMKLPCHRVVNRFGETVPGEVFGAEGLQREWLRAEGVLFLPDGRVNLALARFHIDDNAVTPSQTDQNPSARGGKP